MSPLLLSLLALAALVPAGPAAAKEITAVRVCGTDGCRSTRDHADLRTAMQSEPQATPAGGGRFYRVRTAYGGPGMPDEGWSRSQWIPSLGLLRNDNGQSIDFMLPRPAMDRVLRRLASGLRRFPAARLGPLVRAPAPARVDEVVAAPAPPREEGGGSSGWWALLALLPVTLILAARRRRALR